MTPRERRTVTLGLAVLGIAMLVRFAPPGLQRIRQLHAHAREQIQTLAEARRAVEGWPARRDSLARELSALAIRTGWLLDGGSPAQAGASLDAFVTRTAEAQSMRVVRMHPLPDTVDGFFGRVVTRAELEGDIRGLSGLLTAVATSDDPVVNMSHLTITAPTFNQPAGVPERLRIEATIGGWYLPGADSVTAFGNAP